MSTAMSTAAARITAAAGDSVAIIERAENVLDELTALVPYVGAQLAAWDVRTGVHRTVAHRGYGKDMLDALNGPSYRNDPGGWLVMESVRAPMRWRDCPFNPKDSPFYVGELLARGFVEGLTAPLFRRDGTYVGMLALNTDSPHYPDDATREVLQMLSGGLVPLVDLTASARQYVAMATPGADAIVLDSETEPVPLTGSAEQPPAALLGVAREMVLRGRLPIRFRWLDGQRDLPLHVQLMPCAQPGYRAILCWSPEPIPYGLTRRELEVLAAIIAGASNGEIAAATSTSPRTVSTHVEHVLAKLSVSSRTAAATKALQQGLFLPDQKYVV